MRIFHKLLVFLLKTQKNPISLKLQDKQPAYLDVAVGGASDKELLAGIDGETLNGRLVRLEAVPQLALPHIHDTHITLLAGGDQKLVLRRVHHARRTLVVARERCRFTYLS